MNGGRRTLRGGAAQVNAVRGGDDSPRSLSYARARMRLALAIAACCMASTLLAPSAWSEEPAVARARFRAQSVEHTGGTVFFLETKAGVVAIYGPGTNMLDSGEHLMALLAERLRGRNR